MFDTARLRPAVSAESVPHWARPTAVRVSHEFFITGDEALLERAFAEAFVEHSALPAYVQLTNGSQPGGPGRRRWSRNDYLQNDLGEDRRLAPESRAGAPMA